MKKLLSLVLGLALLWSTSIKAIDKQQELNYVEKNVESIIVENDRIELTTTVKDNLLRVVGKSSQGECSVFTYDLINKLAKLDDRIVNVKFASYANKNRSMTFYGDDYPAVYIASYSNSFSGEVSSVAAIATLIGGAVAAAALAGIAIPSIVTYISNWVSVVGLVNLVAGYFISGEFNYDLYRTKNPVMFPPAKRPLTAYRYQNASVDFSIAGHKFHHDYNAIGDWWYAEKPF